MVHHHTHMRTGAHAGTAKIARVEGNAFRLDMEEAARLAGLQFKVDSVLNNRREVVGLFAGDFVAEHRAGVKFAREVYATELLKDMDVLVINCYPDECQFPKSTWIVPSSVREGSDVVIINHAHAGQVVHQYNSRFGTDYGGSGWKVASNAGHLSKSSRDDRHGSLPDQAGPDGAWTGREGGMVQELGGGAGRPGVATWTRHQGRHLPLPVYPDTRLTG